jgi:hypothetical protein
MYDRKSTLARSKEKIDLGYFEGIKLAPGRVLLPALAADLRNKNNLERTF